MSTTRVSQIVGAACAAAIVATLSGCSFGPSPAGGSASSAPAGSSASAASTPKAGSGGSSGGSVASKVVNVCSFVPVAQVAALAGIGYTDATPSRIAYGQDQCVYSADDAPSTTVIDYAPGAGVTWKMMTDVLSNSGDPVAVPGLGDKAMEAGIEVDVQIGQHLIAVEGGSLNLSSTEAVAKAFVAAIGR